ncbi:hypothetical protein [Myxococcus landrumensis]|uniref:Lipoprotein n=1 Tax=Myxococcus landrumensis TaxID=2813577 RepID=A0ABX7N103_9BACT|nr:hypothetical protein [Myxococcus landrumus]QSQ12389.1 hypothetical protein JY572_29075 [Myxococcus landrumus]
MRALVPATAVLLLVAGCATEKTLRPSTEAQVLPDRKNTAVAEAAGVKLVADGSAWKGSPSNLEGTLTPVYVRLENHSGRTLRIENEDFQLIGAQSRFRYSALPAFPVGSAERSSSMMDEGTGGSGRSSTFYVGAGPGWRSGWGWRGGWGSPFYGPYYPGPPYWGYQCEEPLPTRDMLRKSMPEGTLEDGGTMQGFLYFQSVSGRDEGVVLQARPVDANSGEVLGTLDIPFQVKK